MSQQYPGSPDDRARPAAEPYRISQQAPQQYGQPQYQGQTYGQASQYGQAQQYPGQPYQAVGYGAASYPAQMQAPGSPLLGRAGLAGVLLALVATCVTMFQMVKMMRPFLVESINEQQANGGTVSTTTEIPAELMSQMMPWATGLSLGVLVGLAAWIVCIVAASRRRGRGAAITGIVLGVLSPIIMGVAALLAMLPVLSQLQS